MKKSDKIIDLYKNKEGLNEYFNVVLDEQGWDITGFDETRDHIEKLLPGGSKFGLMVSKNRKIAINDINSCYVGYLKNGLRTNVMCSALSGETMTDAANGTNVTLNALRRLRNAFEEHDTNYPEWLKDIINYAQMNGMDTMCTKGEYGFALLCFLPLTGYTFKVNGDSTEEMFANIDYKADTFSEHRYYLKTMEEKPDSDDYEVINKAKMIKIRLEQFRDTIASNCFA